MMCFKQRGAPRGVGAPGRQGSGLAAGSLLLALQTAPFTCGEAVAAKGSPSALSLEKPEATEKKKTPHAEA